MQITQFTMRNFRSFQQLELRELPPIVLLYGENNVGKSNLIRAIGVWLALFRELAGRSAEERPAEFRLWTGQVVEWDRETLEQVLNRHKLRSTTARVVGVKRLPDRAHTLSLASR